MELGRHARYNSTAGKVTYPFYQLTDDQRIRGVYLAGKPSAGKSETLARWAIDDIRAGNGLALLDPTGQTAMTVLERVPPSRRSDVIWFAPHEYPIPFNILAGVPAARRSYLANSVVDTVKQLFDIDFRASNIKMFVRAAILVLLETPGSTLMGLNYLLTSPEYRRRMLQNVRDPIVRDFWDRTFGEHMTAGNSGTGPSRRSPKSSSWSV